MLFRFGVGEEGGPGARVTWRSARRWWREQRQAGQRLAVERVDQDRLDRVVAIFAAGVGARTGGVDAVSPVALDESQNPLGAPEAVEGPVAEERVDEQGTGGADRGRALATPGGRLHEEVDFVGRQVRGQRAALAGARAAMRGDERVVVEELDLQSGGAHPEALPEQTMRRGVVGAGEDDVTVGVKLGLLPLGELPGRQRQGEQGRALEPLEELERDLLDGAVDAPAGDLEAPAQQMAIAVGEVPEGAAGQGVAFDVVDPTLLHLAFVLGRARPTGRDEEAIVLGALAIAALDLGIVQGGVHDGSAEIIEHDPARNAAEELESGAMQPEPGLDSLVEDELGVLVSTAGQRHHEDPRPAHPAALRIEDLAGGAEVHLRLLAGRDFEPQRGAASGWGEPAQEALDRGVAAGEAVLFDEELPDGLAFHASLVQGEHALAPGLDQRLLLSRALGRRRRQQAGGRRRVGQRASFEDAVAPSPHTVPGHGVTADAKVPGDPTIGLAQLQPAENLTDVGHRTPPSRHSSPPGVGVLQQGFRVTARTRKESGHASPSGSIWPTLGGSVWVTLPGSRWRPRVAQLPRPRWLNMGWPLTDRAPSGRRGSRACAHRCPHAC